MKSEDAAKTSHYTGPINVMTLREVSTYLHVHPSHDLPDAEAPSASSVSRGQ